MKLEYNYHIHTKWCNHAIGEIADYIEKAIEFGYKEIAITDHMPIDNGFYRAISEAQFESFNTELDVCIEKYKHKIKIIKGLECEYYPAYASFYKKLQDLGYDMLLLSEHNSQDLSVDYFSDLTEKDITLYGEEVCEGLNTGSFKILAHPDLFLNRRDKIGEVEISVLNKIFKCCAENKVMVEINITPFRQRSRKYSRIEAFEIAKSYEVTFVIGLDAHEPSVLDPKDRTVIEAMGMARRLGLKMYSLDQ